MHVSGNAPRRYDDVERLVDDIVARVGPRIVLGLPLGIGKANHVANALYARVRADRKLSLEICTALSLGRPSATNALARRFLGPLVERLYAGYPELEYVLARERGTLPANIRVHEFYFTPGALLGDNQAQRDFLSSNYSHVARDVLARGVNVVAQLVARRAKPDCGESYSLGSNPDLTLDLMTRGSNDAGEGIVFVAELCDAMPFMEHDAIVGPEMFDAVLDAPRYQFPLFSVPPQSLGSTAHAIGLHASTLIADGGTLQVGIGALGDALCHALLLRHTRSVDYAALLAALHVGARYGELIACTGGTQPFEQKLYGLSEMVTEALLHLFDAGIVAREVEDRSAREADTVHVAAGSGGVAPRIALHGGFFLGSERFYQRLRDLSPRDRARISMTSISRINQLYGDDEPLRRRQRHAARFANSALKVTLRGGLASDALADGRVLSGVGGQHDFVCMAHALEGARSIIMLPSTRRSGSSVESNVVWSHENCTIPPHLRDIVVTEYGIADLRGGTDGEVAAALLQVADSRFQDGLLREACARGKVPRDHVIPDSYRNNRPEQLQRALRARGDLLPKHPFGTPLTSTEVVLSEVLEALRAKGASWKGRMQLLTATLASGKTPSGAETYLERMALDRPRSLEERWFQRLLLSELRARGRP